MSRLKELISQHPQLSSWVILALGMVVVLFILMPSDLGLNAGQMTTLVISTIVLAGLCAWIIGWD